MTLRRAFARVRALFTSARYERELEAELHAHLELAEQDARAAGLSPADARREALRRFGGIARAKEEHRFHRGVPWLESFLRDLRFGASSLGRRPGFSVIVIAVLALGIGGNVAMFSLIDAVLLKPLPFPEPDRIVSVWEAPRPGVINSTSSLDFLDWRRMSSSFEALSADRSLSVSMAGPEEPARLVGKMVSAAYFQVFPVPVQHGRTFFPEEDQPGAVPSIVLSHAAWQKYFGAAPDILSMRPLLDGVPHQVIGVLAAGAFDRDRTEFWTSLIFSPDQLRREFHWLNVTGRLRRDITVTAATGELQRINASLDEFRPAHQRGGSIVIQPMAEGLVGDGLRRSLLISFAAVVMVLLIACANVANLMLTHGAQRSRELAVRAALGAGRGRLAAQVLTESLLLGTIGGVGGLLLGWLLIQTAAPFLAPSIPFTADLAIDLRVLVFTAAVVLAVVLLVGTLPALQLRIRRLSQVLGQSSRGASASHARLRRAIVVGEVALSLVLASGALLLFRSLYNLQQIDTGIRTEHVITMSAVLAPNAYPTAESAARMYDSLVARLRAMPGIENVGLATHVPLRWIGNGEGIWIPSAPDPLKVRLKRVDAGYFETLGIPVLAGRGIDPQDRLGRPRAIVINEVLAARLREVAGVADPVGQVLRHSVPPSPYHAEDDPAIEVEIVGVVRNELVTGPGRENPPVVYAALAQIPDPGVSLFVRTQTDPSAIMRQIRAGVREVDPHLPLADVETMEEVRASTLTGVSRPAWLVGVFAGVALLLASLGLYGVFAHTVSQRRREIGIRMALGARSGQVLGDVLWDACRTTLVGLAIGLGATIAATRVIGGLLYEVSALDPAMLLLAAALIAAVGLLAGWLPAHQATQVNPVNVLRDEQ